MVKQFTTSHLFLISSLLLPAAVAGNCTCDSGDLQAANNAAVLPYKLAALFAILAASAIGIAIPLACQRFRHFRPDGDVFFMVKAFAAGVILATGFVHILPDAFESLSSPCLRVEPWQGFPIAGVVAMAASIGALMIDSTATGYYRRMHFRDGGGKAVAHAADVENGGEHGGHLHVHTHATHGHAHGEGARVAPEEMNPVDLVRHRVTSQVLELGVMVHSVIIGVSLGASADLLTIKPLMAALSFHQFFEGMGLAGCIVQAKFKCQAMVTMAAFFSLTTPFGVAIGIGISSLYSESSPTSLIVQGIFNSAAAGILIYMALVDLLASDFMNPRVQNNPKIQLGSNISLLLGAGCMSLLAKWA